MSDSTAEYSHQEETIVNNQTLQRKAFIIKNGREGIAVYKPKEVNPYRITSDDLDLNNPYGFLSIAKDMDDSFQLLSDDDSCFVDPLHCSFHTSSRSQSNVRAKRHALPLIYKRASKESRLCVQPDSVAQNRKHESPRKCNPNSKKGSLDLLNHSGIKLASARGQIKSQLKQPAIVDLRSLLNSNNDSNIVIEKRAGQPSKQLSQKLHISRVDDGLHKMQSFASNQNALDLDRDLSQAAVVDDNERSSSPVLRSLTRTTSRYGFYLSEPYEIGIPNLGNTCYVNATLQALLSLSSFTADLEESLNEISDKESCATIFKNLFSARNIGDIRSVKSNAMKFRQKLSDIHPSYGINDQQDANEFLVRFIDHMKRSIPCNVINPIENHLEFKIVEILTCPNCSLEDERHHIHSSICLPFLEHSGNVQQSLQEYTSVDLRPIRCPACQHPNTAVQCKLSSLPRVLIIFINRCTLDGKVLTPFTSPLTFDPLPYLHNPSKEKRFLYQLKALILHLGTSRYSGHYVCNVLCEDGKWRSYNDEKVRIILDSEIQGLQWKRYGYVYFYVLQDIKSK